MATIDVFNGDAFSLVELTTALERVPYKPQLLGQLGIFTPRPISTTSFAVESRNGALNVIQTTERGAPPVQATPGGRTMRHFSTVRLAKGDRLNASEIQNLRAFGTESELATVQSESMRRLISLRDDLDLTLERHRLGAILGIVLDANGDTLYNWFNEWGIAQPTEVDFALGTSGTDVRKKIRDVKRAMQKAGEGAFTPGTRIGALVGDDFYDALLNHGSIKETRLNNERAPLLENIEGYSSVEIEGVTWINYRGTDDGTTLAIDTNSAKFFPIGARDVFQHVQGPGETFDTVNTPGRPFYAMTVPDEKRNAFVDLEVYSYPSMVCTRPKMLLRAKRA